MAKENTPRQAWSSLAGGSFFGQSTSWNHAVSSTVGFVSSFAFFAVLQLPSQHARLGKGFIDTFFLSS